MSSPVPPRRTLSRTGRAALLVFALLCAATVSAARSEAPAPQCTVSPILVNSCRAWLGASVDRYRQVRSDKVAQLEYHEQRIGRRLDVVHTYATEGTPSLGADDLALATRPGTILFANWKATSRWRTADGSDATVNATIDSMARSVKSLGDTKIFMTLHHEPENDVTYDPRCPSTTYRGSAGTPDEYRAMWRNVLARFDAAGVTNVVWAVDFMSDPTYRCLTDLMYPGDDLVDWVVFDNYGSPAKPDYVANVGSMYDHLLASSTPEHDYASKPWGLGEWNIRNATTSAVGASYYDQARAALADGRFPRLKLHMVYDSVGPDGNENRIAYLKDGSFDAHKQAAYAAFAVSPQLTGAWAPADPDAEPGVDPDTTPPSAPAALTAEATATGAVGLAWQPAGDDVGVTGYEVHRDGTLLQTVAGTAYEDATVQPGTTYGYSVRARDAAGNLGPLTEAALVTTPPAAGSEPPPVPRDVAATVVGDAQVDLSWRDGSDDAPADGFVVYRDGSALATLAGDSHSWTDHDVHEGRRYRYAVAAVDADGVSSAPSPAVTADVPDLTAPTAPSALVATPVSSGRTDLSWQAATDAVGVAGYTVYRDGTPLAATDGATTSRDTTAAPGTHTYEVVAVDAAGNRSPASAPATATTPPTADTAAPSAPTALAASGTTYAGTTLTWRASSDDRGVAGYRVFRDGVQVATATSPSSTATGLHEGTAYLFAVRAFDAAGNLSPLSAGLQVTTRADDLAPAAPAGTRATSTVPYRVVLTWSAATDPGGSGVARYVVRRSDRGTTPVAVLAGTVLTFGDTRVKAGTGYSYTVTAVDGRGNAGPASAKAAVRTPAASETRPPTQPTGLRAVAQRGGGVALSWTASKDGARVAGYHVYRGGTYVGDATTTSYADSGLQAGTAYAYTVQAFDTSANTSAVSAQVRVQALP